MSASMTDIDESSPSSRLRRTHYITYPFDASGFARGWAKISGVESLLSRELREQANDRDDTEEFAILSAGTFESTTQIPDLNLRIIPAAPELTEQSREDTNSFWFDQMWAYIHPDAFTRNGVTDDVLKAMFPGLYTHKLGTLDQMLEHYENYGVLRRSASVVSSFADRFDYVLEAVKPESTINWMDFFFAECMLRHVNRLRSLGVFQTFHSQLAHPSELDRTQPGRKLIQAMCEADHVYLHTDRYVRTLEEQIERLHFRKPNISRYDVGVDQYILDQGLATISLTNYEHTIPRFANLNQMQRSVIDEIFRTQQCIPHRFICLDRLDSIKGTHIVLQAIEAYLDSLHTDLTSIQKQYRFFFLMDYYRAYPAFDHRNVWHRYARYVRETIIPRLCSKYPNVIHIADNIPMRILMGPLIQGAHVLSGGVQEGLNLAIQEGLYVNATTNSANSAILGNGAGFAIQTIQSGFGHLAEFPSRGDVQDFANSLRRLVATDSEILRFRTREITEKVITRRTSSVIMRPCH